MPLAWTKGKRLTKKVTEAKVFENPKKCLVLKGNKCSELCSKVLHDIFALKSPCAVKLWKNNKTHPFENVESLQFLCEKNDTSLFAFGNHSKKRPHNLVLGRMHGFQLLDMVEFGITNYEAPTAGQNDTLAGNKPMLCFLGNEFGTNPELTRLKNLLLDFFRGPDVNKINLAGVDSMITVSIKALPTATDAVANALNAKGFVLRFSRHGVTSTMTDKVPNVTLADAGPFMDLTVRRVNYANEMFYKKACKVPKMASKSTTKLEKNLTVDPLGNVTGQIHKPKEDLKKLGLRKFKSTKALRERVKVAKKRTASEMTSSIEHDGGEHPRTVSKKVRHA